MTQSLPVVLVGALLLGAVVVVARPRRAASGSTSGPLPGIESKSPADLYGPFRERLDRLFGELHRAGFKPVLRATWRSPERQAYYLRAGYSKVSRSFHEVSGPDGRREALAADVQDSRWGPDDPRQAPFYRALLARSGAYGLTTGGGWSGARWAGDPEGLLAWDPGHVEADDGPTIDEAHDHGERPWT